MPAPVSKQPAPPTSVPTVRPLGLVAAGGAVLLVLAVLLAWGNSFRGPFVLDDLPAIADNASLRSWWTALNPPNHGETVTGRPLVNLSFALNHQLAGRQPLAADAPAGSEPVDKVFGYHVLNLAIHLGAALALFGLARRTLAGPVLREKFGAAAVGLAWFIALLWAVHPLQTGAVTYIAQRAESLCALCYLLTLWCLARGAEAARSGPWLATGVAACFAGMASKEVMVSAPLLALLLDRACFAGSFGTALRRRSSFYVGLALSWGLLAGLVWHSGNRGGSAGLGLADPSGVTITPWTYLLRQCEAIVHYVRLSVWPDRLVSDYGFDVIADAGQVWPQALLLLAMLGATLWALWRRPVVGFLGAWFFAILAPSSSFIPVITETAAEHRMYLPLAAVAVAAVVVAYALARRLGGAGLMAAAGAGLAVATVLGAATYRRNTDYASAATLWRDAATKRPQNARAHQELALALAKVPGRAEESLAEFREAVRLEPNYPSALNNYATTLLDLGRLADAEKIFTETLQRKPDLAEAHLGLGNALANQGRLAEAGVHFAEAARLKPGLLMARVNHAKALGALGQTAEAVAEFQVLVRELPGAAEAHFNFGDLLGKLGRTAESLAELEAAVRTNPGHVQARLFLGLALYNSGRKAEALPQFEAAALLAPSNPDARTLLATVRRELGR